MLQGNYLASRNSKASLGVEDCTLCVLRELSLLTKKPVDKEISQLQARHSSQLLSGTSRSTELCCETTHDSICMHGGFPKH